MHSSPAQYPAKDAFNGYGMPQNNSIEMALQQFSYYSSDGSSPSSPTSLDGNPFFFQAASKRYDVYKKNNVANPWSSAPYEAYEPPKCKFGPIGPPKAKYESPPDDRFEFFDNVHVPPHRVLDLQRQNYYLKENVTIKSNASLSPIESPSKPWKEMIGKSWKISLSSHINFYFCRLFER